VFSWGLSEIGALSLKCSSKVFCAVYKTGGSSDSVFLAQFVEEYPIKNGCDGRKQPQIKNFVRL